MGTNTLTHRSLFNCQSIAHRRSLKTKRFTTKPSIKSIAVAHNDRRIVAFAPLPRNINIRLKNIRYSTEYVLNNSQAGLISVLTSADVTDSRLWSFDGSWMGSLDDDRWSTQDLSPSPVEAIIIPCPFIKHYLYNAYVCTDHLRGHWNRYIVFYRFPFINPVAHMRPVCTPPPLIV